MILIGFRCSCDQPVSQSAIAEKLYLTEATVSRHISTLVNLGLLARKEDTVNRRKHIITVTPKGNKAFDTAHTIVDQELASIFSIIKEKDRKHIIENFEQVLLLLGKK